MGVPGIHLSLCAGGRAEGVGVLLEACASGKAGLPDDLLDLAIGLAVHGYDVVQHVCHHLLLFVRVVGQLFQGVVQVLIQLLFQGVVAFVLPVVGMVPLKLP